MSSVDILFVEKIHRILIYLSKKITHPMVRMRTDVCGCGILDKKLHYLTAPKGR